MDLDRPLAEGRPPRRVVLVAGSAEFLPDAVHVMRDGRRLLVSAAGMGGVPDSVVIEGAWDDAGLPVGGSHRAAAPVPPRPGPPDRPGIVRVDYVPPPAGPALNVVFAGAPFDAVCPEPLRLLPAGISLGAEPGAAESRIPLAAPLSPGVHVLELRSDCLVDPPPGGVGLARSFTVGGPLVYPNPVRGGAPITVAGVGVGGGIELIDVRGIVIRAWRAGGGTEILDPGDLAPGLYWLAVEDRDGRPAGRIRLAVLR